MSDIILSTFFANNILSRSFRDEIAVSPLKLQGILYIVESEYSKKTGKFLFAEAFSTWTGGPTLFSVFGQFACFKDGSINEYAKDAQGEVFVIDEDSVPRLKVLSDDVWEKTKRVGEAELLNILREPGSAWDRAFQSEKPFLERQDILADESYRQPLGWEPKSCDVIYLERYR